MICIRLSSRPRETTPSPNRDATMDFGSKREVSQFLGGDCIQLAAIQPPPRGVSGALSPIYTWKCREIPPLAGGRGRARRWWLTLILIWSQRGRPDMQCVLMCGAALGGNRGRADAQRYDGAEMGGDPKMSQTQKKGGRYGFGCVCVWCARAGRRPTATAAAAHSASAPRGLPSCPSIAPPRVDLTLSSGRSRRGRARFGVRPPRRPRWRVPRSRRTT